MSLLLAGVSTMPMSSLAGISTTPMGSHPVYEIIYFTEVDGTVLVKEQEFAVRPGNILLIPPNTPHAAGKRFSSFRELFFWSDEAPAAPGLTEGEFVLWEDDEEGTILQLMTILVRRFSNANKNDTALSLLYRLILELLAEKHANAAQRNDLAAEEVRRYILTHHQDPELSLSEVLAATGYQRDHIRRRFQAAYGMTPSEYLTSLRLENAKRLLRQRKKLHLSIAQIANMCGYYDGLYFSRMFKKATGISPKDYSLE